MTPRTISDRYYEMALTGFELDHAELNRVGAYWTRDWLAYCHQSGYQAAAARYAKSRGWRKFTFKLRGAHCNKIVDYGTLYARTREAAARLICAELKEVLE